MADHQSRLNLIKPSCKYGLSCFRKNPDHFEQFSHPSSEIDGEVKGKPQNKISTKKQIVEGKNGKLESLSVGTTARSRSPSPYNRKRSMSPAVVARTIKEMFLVEMPEDFYKLWEFFCTVNEKQPSEIFAEIGLHLVGPYDVLSNKISRRDVKEDNILRHYRYFYDPPEFQTVIMQDGDDDYHIGYFRDDPKEMPFGLACSNSSLGSKFSLMGDNIFAAMNFLLVETLKRESTSVSNKFRKVQENLQTFAKKHCFSLSKQTSKTKDRNQKVNSKTFHGFGMVVPVDKRGIGYRSLSETDAYLQRIFANLAKSTNDSQRRKMAIPLDHMITNVQFANDECDFGMGLELGLDLFSFGETCLHRDILVVLPLAYELLKRPEYARILKAHLKDRKKGPHLSIKKV